MRPAGRTGARPACRQRADGAQIVSDEVYRPGPDGRAVPATLLRTETLGDLVAAGLDVQGAAFPWWGAG